MKQMYDKNLKFKDERKALSKEYEKNAQEIQESNQKATQEAKVYREKLLKNKFELMK